jgi:hypothetical protein
MSTAVVLATAMVAGACHSSSTIYLYEPIDLAYFDTAPEGHDDKITIDRPVAEVWSALEKSEAWQTFDPGIAEASWTSERPLHAGSTRHVVFSEWMGSGNVDEIFFIWDTNERMAFYMHQGTSPMVHSYGELFMVTDLGDGATEVEFRTAYTLSTRLENSVASGTSWVLNLGYKDLLRNLKRYVEDRTVAADPASPPQRTPRDRHPSSTP